MIYKHIYFAYYYEVIEQNFVNMKRYLNMVKTYENIDIILRRLIGWLKAHDVSIVREWILVFCPPGNVDNSYQNHTTLCYSKYSLTYNLIH